MVACQVEDPEREISELGDRIAVLAAHIQAATYRLLILIREFDDQDGWGGGFHSCAHWLNWRVGMSLGAAREKVRVAHALEELPLMSEAFRRGEISYAKVRAMTRIATPEIEADLLTMARAATATQVEKIVRGYRRADPGRENDRAKKQYLERYLRTYTDHDGTFVIHGRLPAEQGALIKKALEVITDALWKQDREALKIRERRSADRELGEPPEAPDLESASDLFPGSTPTSPATLATEYLSSKREKGVTNSVPAEIFPTSFLPDEATPPLSFNGRKADALVYLARKALADYQDTGTPPDQTQVVVHIDAEVLVDPASDGRSELENGSQIAAETARRLACDAGIVPIVKQTDGRVLDVGRRSRSLPIAMRRALRSRDRACRFPGCTHDLYLEAHHIKHWAEGGETKLTNLVQLCPFHHHLVHEGGYRVETTKEGEIVFHHPRGRRIPWIPPSNNLPDHIADDPEEMLRREHEEESIDITPRTLTVWDGYAPDIGLAIECLLERQYPDPRLGNRESPDSSGGPTR